MSPIHPIEILILIFLITFLFAIFLVYLLYKERSKLKAFREELIKRNQKIEELEDQLTREKLAYQYLTQEINRLNAEILDFKDKEKIYNQKFEECAKLQGSYNQLQDQLEKAEFELIQKDKEILKLQDKINELDKEIVVTKNNLLNAKERLIEQQKMLDEAKKELSNQFEHIASKLFNHNRVSFTKESKEQLNLLLKPWQEQIENFRKRLDELHNQQVSSVGELKGELKQLKELNVKLSKEAEALTKALSSSGKTQGNWGELVLERLLEAAGLREGIEFKKEYSLNDEEGKKRPDIVVFLPQDKHIIIDSKVSLVSYSKAIECEDEKEKEKYIKAHRASIKRHIDELAAKNYHKLSQLKAPEFTLMFIPIEGAYIMALESDPQLFEYAFERGVAVVTPPTLFTTLKTISQLWKLAKQDENMAALAREAANLHDKFVAFYEEFLTIKSKLLNAIDAWESADSKIKNGRGNILSKIEKIGKLSGKTKKELKYEKEEI